MGGAISLLLGWLSVRGIDWDLVVAQFQEFPVAWAVLSMIVVVVANILRACRWQALFVSQRLPLMRLFVVQNAGIGLNNLVPIRVVSEGVQFALLTLRYRVKPGVALATMSVERVLDMVVTSTLLLIGLSLLPDKGDFLLYVVGAFVFAMGSALAIPLMLKFSHRPFMNRIPVVAAMVGSLLDMSKSRGALCVSFLLTLGHWLLLGMAAWILAHGMGLDMSPFVATLTILGTIYFTTSVPALPSGLGTFEFAVVYVLKVFGVSQAMAFSYGVVIHAVFFLPPIVVAVLLFSTIGLRGFRKDAATEALETSTVAPSNDLGRRI